MNESLTDDGKTLPQRSGKTPIKLIIRKKINLMKMLNENEMNLVNGGILCYTPPRPLKSAGELMKCTPLKIGRNG